MRDHIRSLSSAKKAGRYAAQGFLVSWFVLLTVGRSIDAKAAEPQPALLKSQAYHLYEQRRFAESADFFRRYVESTPADLRAAIDYAGLLSELKRHADAAKFLEDFHTRNPRHEAAFFKLGVEYVLLNRPADAQRVFDTLAQSSNTDLAAAAGEAARRLRTDVAREAKMKAEMRVFELAKNFQRREVVEAVAELEKQGPLSWTMEMQRLYALQGLAENARALEIANRLAAAHPEAVDLAFFRAEVLILERRRAEADAIFRQIERDYAGKPEGAEATRRLQAGVGVGVGGAKAEAEEKIFDLARAQKHREVLAAIGDLEKQGPLSLVMELQRLYALQAVGQGADALERANRLAAAHPQSPELALFRVELLMQAGQTADADRVLQQVEREHADNPSAMEARKRLRAEAARRVKIAAEERVFELARKQQHREVIAAISALETQGELSLVMQMQRIYALQGLGETSQAIRAVEAVALTHPESTELALLRADLLTRNRDWEQAGALLRQIKREHTDTPVEREAERRLQALPPVANLDKDFWGEAYLSGDYLGRFGTVVGSGFIRQGAYVPCARRLQPYAEFRFAVDTRSGAGAQRSVIADNFVSLSLGLRVQPLAAEYFFVYVSGGANLDLLSRRNQGDWDGDFQAGLYGFKSWGPGTVLRSVGEGETIATTGSAPPAGLSTNTVSAPPAEKTNRLFWRGDWFTDVGMDFSYYDRFSNWIGYVQAHEGFRLFQCGRVAAFDVYLVENASFDTRGSYFDNLGEIGPGARWLWLPRRRWEVVARVEWLNGFYFGRDDLRSRGNRAGQYDEFRAGLSVGVTW